MSWDLTTLLVLDSEVEPGVIDSTSGSSCLVPVAWIDRAVQEDSYQLPPMSQEWKLPWSALLQTHCCIHSNSRSSRRILKMSFLARELTGVELNTVLQESLKSKLKQKLIWSCILSLPLLPWRRFGLFDQWCGKHDGWQEAWLNVEMNRRQPWNEEKVENLSE